MSLETPDDNQPRSWGKWAVALAALFAVALVALIAIQAARRKAQMTDTLPNGTVVQFLGSAVGTSTFTTEKPWQRYAKRVLPGGMRGWLPNVSSGNCSSSTNSVTFYFRITAPGGGPPAMQFWQNYRAIDDHGFAYPQEGGSCSFGGGTAGQIYGFILRSFPRRQEDLKFSFLDAQSKELLSLRLPNPIRGPFPEWKPERLPITHTNGPVTLTLESLSWKTNYSWNPLAPKWRLESADSRWKMARTGYAWISDPTGNEGSFTSLEERAWRLRTVVHRQRDQDFDPVERTVITNLIPPAAGEYVKLDYAAQCAGVTLLVRAFCGPGELHLTNGTTMAMTPATRGSGGWSGTTSYSGTTIETWSAPKNFFLVEASGVKPDYELRFRLRDADGQAIKLDEAGGYSYRQAAQSQVHLPKFDTPTNPQPFSLEIIVSRPLEFVFTLDPREIKGVPGATRRN